MSDSSSDHRPQTQADHRANTRPQCVLRVIIHLWSVLPPDGARVNYKMLALQQTVPVYSSSVQLYSASSVQLYSSVYSQPLTSATLLVTDWCSDQLSIYIRYSSGPSCKGKCFTSFGIYLLFINFDTKFFICI